MGHGFLSGGVRTNQWFVRGGHTVVKDELINSLKGHRGEPYYYGFRGGRFLKACLKETDQNLNFITHTNVFMFNNAKRGRKLLTHVLAGDAGDVVVFANEYGRKNADQFTTLKHFYAVFFKITC
jgi:hypothetical protein